MLGQHWKCVPCRVGSFRECLLLPLGAKLRASLVEAAWWCFYGHNTTPWNRAFHIRLPFWPHPDCIKGNGLEAGRELVRVRDGFSKLRSMVARDEGWRTQAYLAQPKPDWRQTLSWADHEPSWAQLGPNLGQTWAQHGENLRLGESMSSMT